MMTINGEAFKIDLGVKEKYGKTGIQFSFHDRIWRCAQNGSNKI